MTTEKTDATELSIEAVMMRMLKNLPPEKLPSFLDALVPDPAQRLAGLSAPQILDAVSPEMRAALAEKLQH